MREIKFRGKRIDNGEWIYGYLYGKNAIIELTSEYTVTSLGTLVVGIHEVDPYTVGQDTGVEDKNDIMTSEHDIIKVYIHNGLYLEELVAEIIFIKGQFGIRYGESYKAFYPLATFFKPTKTEYISNVGEVVVESKPMFEIIGNIFDNPELLSE